ncbi:unnamed protein product [Clonostachys byssicola]|uniref:NmrA-like domain-containing protein n=1 Tax=Clonostachys byssicola TaxID=160290 RepID=A0A9N9UGC8_9HYPO|nr:unnamed protein product [Clonostachys byssicola]
MKVALAGATGNLGRPILKVLLDAGLLVTVLSRATGNSPPPATHPNLVVKKVDFDSVPDLKQALEGVEVVVSCLATTAIGSQNPLIDAAEAVGVKRFIPAEFGMDPLNPLCAQLPVCKPKVSTQAYLLEKYKSNTNFTWTGVANGLFLDWGMEVGFIIDPAKRTATLYNGGDVPFSVTLLDDIAKAVLGIIRNQAKTVNRVVYIHSTVTTQNMLIQYAKEKDGREWTTAVKSTAQVLEESLAEMDRAAQGTGDLATAMLGFSVCGMWDPAYGCDFSDRLDNEVLGIQELSESDLKKLVQSFVVE